MTETQRHPDQEVNKMRLTLLRILILSQVVAPANPTEVEDLNLTSFSGKSLCVGNSEFCDDPEVFPEILVENLIRDFKNGDGKEKGHQWDGHDDEGGHKDLEKIVPKLEPSVASSFKGNHDPLNEREGQESGLEIPESPICPRYSTYIYPRRGLTQSNGYKFILNSHGAGERFQAVRVELCINAGQNCEVGVYNTFMKTACRQSHAYVKLLAVPNHESTKNVTIQNIELDSFKFPSSCICHKRPSRIFGRILH